MPDNEDTFLPRLRSVFYAVFDHRIGPKIVYQVPEGLIATRQDSHSARSNGGSVPATPSSETSSPVPSSINSGNGIISRNSSLSVLSPTEMSRPGGRERSSPNHQSSSSRGVLFHFQDIQTYIIPSPALCGRLVTCSTKRNRIIGFPVELKGRYERNYFRFNLCFVFDRGADLSCYEPIVRKVSRVLKSCEEESQFLSNPNRSKMVHVILEQLYEDLNSYSETSIQIDQFNSIELKIFPFYPNPPPVHDWMVPLALINLTKRVEENWDLTIAKVCEHINSVNHVSRIAHLANCDITLTRKAIAHLLYYQVIMTIDIFQYSNMYTLRKSVQWLADEAHVKEECGPYVTKPGHTIADWPKLLHLYSRLRPGKTVYEWMQAHDVESLGIDVRRFTSFGVIKGFLRRIHRYPFYIPPSPVEGPLTQDAALMRKRAKSFTGQPLPLRFNNFGQPISDENAAPLSGRLSHGSIFFPSSEVGDSPGIDALTSPGPPISQPYSANHRARRASAAEKVLEQLHSKHLAKSGSVSTNPRSPWINYQGSGFLPATAAPATGTSSTASLFGSSHIDAPTSATPIAISSRTLNDSPSKSINVNTNIPRNTSNRPDSRRQSLISPPGPPSSPVLGKASLLPSRPTRSVRSPSMSQPSETNPNDGISIPPAILPQLLPLLDGDHHTDEISVKFEVGWPLLEQWLVILGGGSGNGDFGRVQIIYR